MIPTVYSSRFEHAGRRVNLGVSKRSFRDGGNVVEDVSKGKEIFIILHRVGRSKKCNRIYSAMLLVTTTSFHTAQGIARRNVFLPLNAAFVVALRYRSDLGGNQGRATIP